MEHIHERCSRTRQGLKDTSSWMLGSREEALKLASAWGAGTREQGAGLKEGAWKKRIKNEGGETCGREGML